MVDFKYKPLHDIKDFAIEAHAGQRRKYEELPYSVHPLRVAHHIDEMGYDLPMIAAAILHDVIEDTAITSIELLVFLHSVEGIEPDVAIDIHKLVMDLTDIYTNENFPHLNRKTRKTLEARRLGNVCADAQTIKYCDLYDNTKSIVKHDPKFAKVYMEEKSLLLEFMMDGDPTIRSLCLSNVEQFKISQGYGLPYTT